MCTFPLCTLTASICKVSSHLSALNLGVTLFYFNEQLNIINNLKYLVFSQFFQKYFGVQRDSNPRKPEPQSDALPTKLWTQRRAVVSIHIRILERTV